MLYFVVGVVEGVACEEEIWTSICWSSIFNMFPALHYGLAVPRLPAIRRELAIPCLPANSSYLLCSSCCLCVGWLAGRLPCVPATRHVLAVFGVPNFLPAVVLAILLLASSNAPTLIVEPSLP